MLLPNRNPFSLTASALSLASTRGQTVRMRPPILAVLLLMALLPTSGRADTPTVCFTPGQDCTDLVVSEIANAKQQILVQAYSFTSVAILAALKAAHGRGVDVEVIVDKSL